jgi:hypothetical protein
MVGRARERGRKLPKDWLIVHRVTIGSGDPNSHVDPLVVVSQAGRPAAVLGGESVVLGEVEKSEPAGEMEGDRYRRCHVWVVSKKGIGVV